MLVHSAACRPKAFDGSATKAGPGGVEVGAVDAGERENVMAYRSDVIGEVQGPHPA
jgi:hypothetical protein